MRFAVPVLIFTLFVSINVSAQTGDAALRSAMQADATARAAAGKLPVLSAAEHLSRADVYMANRMFPQAREHWQIVLENYPDDAGRSRALFGHGRSYMWEREYGKAVEWFDKLIKDFPSTKDGREGLSFKGASLVRMGRNLDAARAYEQYTVMFPNGERIESAYLNLIDAYREAENYAKAVEWANAAIKRFEGKPTAVNARHARLRMEIFRENWTEAVTAADELLSVRSFSGSMASADEAKYLKAFALEKAGKKADARTALSSITPSLTSYYSGLAADQLGSADGGIMPTSLGAASESQFPIMFRAEVLRSARKNNIDPRFLLAIMKQESSFKAAAKSPAGARGLLQLVYDTALKYNDKAGYKDLHPDDLYRPEVNIAIGSVYVADLKGEFGGLYEAIAASYNGGEDNTRRWLDRSRPKHAGIFVSEVGFAETKNYVLKVMNNFRIYKKLYDDNLQRRAR